MAASLRSSETSKLGVRPVLRWTNAQFDWDSFDPHSYRRINYGSLRDDDRQIIERVRDFFASSGVHGARGIDVGSGANLYPAFAMLPFCNRLDLRELARPNVAWLEIQVREFDPAWDEFWLVFGQHPAYAVLEDPRIKLARIAHVRRGSVFKLPARTWDVGTMFFVACSLSTRIEEFHRAVRCFVEALRPGAPFACAFMLGSEGYNLSGLWLPAVCVDTDVITRSLASVAYDVRIETIGTGAPLREGYSGMLVAMGRAAG